MLYKIDRGMIINALNEMNVITDMDIGLWRSDYTKPQAIKIAKHHSPDDFYLKNRLAKLLSNHRSHHFISNHQIASSDEIITNYYRYKNSQLLPASN